MKPISVWGWLGGHDGQRPFGQIWPGCRGNTPTLFRRTSWDFNDHRESGPWFNVSFNISFNVSKSCNIKCCGLLLSWIWLPLTTYLAPHYSCTSPMDCISHHSLHSHIPIHHYTNHTAVTNHSLALIVSPHLHLIHTHTFQQHSYMHSPRSLVLAPADISECYSSCYLLSLCLTPDPGNSEPVTPTSAWYCLRLCPASDIPVFARWPLPVWFCLLNILLHLDPHAFDQSLQLPLCNFIVLRLVSLVEISLCRAPLGHQSQATVKII